MKRLLLLGLLIVAFVLAPFGRVEAAPADLPDQINYQGTLMNGENGMEGNVSMTFEIFENETGGTAIWTETQNVVLTKGYFNADLGKVNPINLPFDSQYFLQVTVGGGEPYPRTAMALVPYAGMAKAASTADTATVALGVVEEGVTQEMLAPGIQAIPMGAAGGDLEGMYPDPTIKPEAVLNNIPDGGITQNMLAPNVSTTPSGPASGDLTGTYPDPIIAPRAVTADKIGLGAVALENLSTEGGMEGTVLYVDANGSAAWGAVLDLVAPGSITPMYFSTEGAMEGYKMMVDQNGNAAWMAPTALDMVDGADVNGQVIFWKDGKWEFSYDAAPVNGQVMTWDPIAKAPMWKDANFTLPITHNGPTENVTAIDITKTDVEGGGVYIKVPQTDTNGEALKVMGGGDNVATAHIDRTTDGESSDGALLVTANLTTLEGTSYGAKFMTDINQDNGYMTAGVKVDNNVVGATAEVIHKGMEVTTMSDNGLAVAGHFESNNANTNGWIDMNNPNPTAAVVIRNTSNVQDKIALITEGDIYWNSTAHGHMLEVLNTITVGEGMDAITITAPAAGDNLTFDKDVDFDGNINVAGQISTGSFTIANDITVGQNMNITGDIITTDGNFTSTNGTVTAAALVGNGAGITDIDADNITTGTLADARLTANVALYDAAAPTFDNDVTAPHFVGDLTGTADAAIALTGDLDVDQLMGDVNDDDIIDRAIVDAMTVYTDVAPTFTVNVTAPMFMGDLTGDVTGNVSGTASNITGDLDVDQLAGDTNDDDMIDDALLTANIAKYNDAAPNFANDLTAPNFNGNLVGGTVNATSGTFTADISAVNGTFTGNVGVTGDVTAANFNGNVMGGTISGTTGTFTDDVTVGNTITLTAATGAVNMDLLVVDGQSTLTGDVTTGSDLSVGQDLSVGTGNVVINQGNLNFPTGPGLNDDAQINMLGATAQINITNGTINNTAGTFNGNMINANTVKTQNANVSTLLDAVAAQIENLVVDGADDAVVDFTAPQALLEDLTVNGATTLNTLSVTGNLNVGTAPNLITLDATNGHVTANQFNGDFNGDGANVTNINATNIATGTLADARLSNNVALYDAAAPTFDNTLTAGGLSTAGNVNAATGDFSTDLEVGANIDLTAANGHVTATQFNGNLVGNVTGDVTGNVTGNLTGDVDAVSVELFADNTYAAETIDLDGATGNATFTGDLAANGDVNLGDDATDVITVTGNTDFNGDVNLVGATSDLDVDGTLTVDNHTSLNTASVGNTLIVTGVTTANGTLVVADADGGPSADLDVNGEADFLKAVTMTSTLEVSGDATFENNVTLNDATATLEVDGTTQLDGALNANGVVTIADDVSATAAIELDVNGDADFAKAVGFNGVVTIADDVPATAAIELDVNGDADFAKTVGVTGEATFANNVTLNNAAATLEVDGTTQLDGAVNVDGAADFDGTAQFDGVVTISDDAGATASIDLDVNGDADFAKNVTLGDAAADQIAINGTASFAQPINGVTTFDSDLTIDDGVSGNPIVLDANTGAITAAGLVTADELSTTEFTVGTTGNVETSGTLTVNNTSDFNNSIDVNSTTTTITAVSTAANGSAVDATNNTLSPTSYAVNANVATGTAVRASATSGTAITAFTTAAGGTSLIVDAPDGHAIFMDTGMFIQSYASVDNNADISAQYAAVINLEVGVGNVVLGDLPAYDAVNYPNGTVLTLANNTGGIITILGTSTNNGEGRRAVMAGGNWVLTK